MVGVTNTGIILKPCPVCGKKPCITGNESPGHGAWCTIQCKPFLRKPHLKIEEGKASWDRAFQYAKVRWNKEAERNE